MPDRIITPSYTVFCGMYDGSCPQSQKQQSIDYTLTMSLLVGGHIDHVIICIDYTFSYIRAGYESQARVVPIPQIRLLIWYKTNTSYITDHTYIDRVT